MSVAKNSGETTARHRPKALTVFAAAFVAGAAAAVGINSLLDVHIARSKPQIECEPIFVALRSMPQGAPVTVWDVALRDWPKAMLPGSALRAHDSFEGLLLRHPLREGQPLLAVQLMRAESSSGSRSGPPAAEAFVSPVPAAPAAATATTPSAQTDLWTPAESIVRTESSAVPVHAPQPAAVASTDIPAAPPAARQQDNAPTADPAATPAADVASVPADLDAADAAGAESVAVASEAGIEPQLTEPVAAEPEAGVVGQGVAADNAGPQPEVPAEVAAAPTPAGSDGERAATESAPTSDAAASDVEAQQPIDPATLPSVVTSKDESQAAAAPEPPREQPRRYLVVPERIALQADASFSAPPATTTAAPATVPPVTTPATSRSQQPAARQPAPRAASRNGQPTAAPRQQAQPSRVQQTQPNRGQQPQPRPRPSSATNTTTTSPQRPRGRAFPAMAAGLDAIGQQWQQLTAGEDDATATGRSAAAGTNDRRR